MKKCYLILILVAVFSASLSGFSQTITMGQGPATVNSCSATILDPGGNGNYPNNSSVTQTICSANGECLQIDWTSFDMENVFGFDYLNVYSGPDVFSPSLGFFLSGTSIPQQMISTSGCVTFEFTSDATGSFGGFSANVSCVTCPISYSDCGNELYICQNSIGFQITPNGFGTTNEIPTAGTAASNPNTNPASTNSGCLLAGELNSTWMVITVVSNGLLEFSMGDGINTLGCLDWIMYPYNGPSTCTGIINGTQAPIRCNWNGACQGITGLASPGNIPANGSPFDFEPPINATVGQQFLIVLSNYSSQTVNMPMNFMSGPTYADVSCTPFILSADSTNITCFGGNDGSIDLNISGGFPPYTITWNPPVSTDTLATNLPVGNYGITVSDSTGNTATLTIHLQSPTQLVPTATLQNILCNGNTTGSIQAGATGGTPPYTYTWSVPGNNSTLGNIGAGTYSVTVTDQNNCQAVLDSLILTEPPPLSMSLTSTIDSCYRGTGTALAAVSGGTGGTYTYLWAVDGQTTNPAVGLSVGGYTVTATDSNGCTISGIVQITESPIPNASFSYSPELPTAMDPLVVFTDLSSLGTVAWDWNFGNAGFSNDQNPQFNFPGEGSYPVSLIVSNSYGCKDTVIITIDVVPTFFVYIPESFTPDNDGLNDTWHLKGLGISKDGFSVNIYTRWGNLVYSSTDPDFAWNGRWRNTGSVVQNDVYTYRIILLETSGIEHVYNGRITLFR
jgi:gliding motility-associated-like protein